VKHTQSVHSKAVRGKLFKFIYEFCFTLADNPLCQQLCNQSRPVEH